MRKNGGNRRQKCFPLPPPGGSFLLGFGGGVCFRINTEPMEREVISAAGTGGDRDQTWREAARRDFPLF
jgi:hypothetical protein